MVGPAWLDQPSVEPVLDGILDAPRPRPDDRLPTEVRLQVDDPEALRRSLSDPGAAVESVPGRSDRGPSGRLFLPAILAVFPAVSGRTRVNRTRVRFTMGYIANACSIVKTISKNFLWQL